MTPVWSLSCFYVRKGYRRRGTTSALIAAALTAARRAGAPALEAYPLDADLTPSASSTGYASTLGRRRIQDGGLPRATAPDHAPRPHGGATLTAGSGWSDHLTILSELPRIAAARLRST